MSLAAVLRAHVDAIADQPRHRAIPGSRERARSYVESVLRHAGLKITHSRYRSLPSLLRTSDYGRRGWPFGAGGRIEGCNVLAHRGDLDGATWVTAHLDSVYCSPGADDNASGVAIALELGRRLSGDQVAIVLTDNEESAMLGARQLVRRGPRPSQVINLESLGYFCDEADTQQVLPDIAIGHPNLAATIRASDRRGDFVLVVHRPTSSAMAAAIQEQLGARGLLTYPLEDRRWNGAGQAITARLNPIGLGLDRSDHAPFWRARIPALMLTDTFLARNPNYHRPTDTPDTLDYDRMALITEALAAALSARGDGHPERPFRHR